MKDFFKQLSLYYYNENDLSNMTCALCNSSMWFRERFIHFFFPQINVDDIESIVREVMGEFIDYCLCKVKERDVRRTVL